MAIIDFARAEAAKRARHLQHPQLCLDAIQTGVSHGGLAGLKKVNGIYSQRGLLHVDLEFLTANTLHFLDWF